MAFHLRSTLYGFAFYRYFALSCQCYYSKLYWLKIMVLTSLQSDVWQGIVVSLLAGF